MLKKIAVTGPESTGKSTLARLLADHYHTLYREEYARGYLDRINRPYKQADIEKIAKEQLQQEKQILNDCSRIFIADTELLVIKIWMEHKYGNTPEWIDNEIQKQDYDLYLLCDIDIEWEDDPQREHPHLREHFLNKYLSELKKYGFPYAVISGTLAERIKKATYLIDAL